jgi:hypothetical protein
MADISNKIKDYIAKITSASVTNGDIVANMHEADKLKTQKWQRCPHRSDSSPQLLPNLLLGASKTRRMTTPTRIRVPAATGLLKKRPKLRNMGGYCCSHSFHPVSPNHDSVTCQFKKKDGHSDAVTWKNCLKGNTYWPKAICVAIKQQNHPTWEDKDNPI